MTWIEAGADPEGRISMRRTCHRSTKEATFARHLISVVHDTDGREASELLGTVDRRESTYLMRPAVDRFLRGGTGPPSRLALPKSGDSAIPGDRGGGMASPARHRVNPCSPFCGLSTYHGN